MKISNKDILEIYNKILAKKRDHDVPYVLSCKTYGIGWTDLKKRVEKVKADKILDKTKII